MGITNLSPNNSPPKYTPSSNHEDLSKMASFNIEIKLYLHKK
jgi:hypothetical protein